MLLPSARWSDRRHRNDLVSFQLFLYGICGGQSRAGTDGPVVEYAGSKFLRNMASLFFVDGATIILTCSFALCEPDDCLWFYAKIGLCREGLECDQ
jgi:hypothetical protein